MYDYRPVPQYDIEYRFSTFQLLYFEIKGAILYCSCQERK
jgi:hypothetical protein